MALIQGELAALRGTGSVDSEDIDGLSIEYWRYQGGQNTIVFLHGNSAGKEVFYHQFAGLQDAGYDLLAIDLPGHGGSADSPNPERDYNFPALALRLHRLLKVLGISRPLIAGWSLGGHIAIEMAGRGFDMGGLMLFGTPPMGPGMVDFERAFVASDAMAVTLKEERTAADLAVYTKGLYGSLDPIPPAFLDLARRADGRCPSHVGTHWSKGEEGCHQRTVVRGWERPICILHGKEDAFVSEGYLATLTAEHFWTQSVVMLPDVGHAPFLEAPNVFNDTVEAFAKTVFSNP